jgi:peptide/nickel transport system permease protein
MSTLTNQANDGQPASGVADGLLSVRPRSTFRMGLRAFLKNRGAIVGSIVLGTWIVIALTVPWIAPHDPLGLAGGSRESPSREFPMGTDRLGRDVFTRVLYGSRISLQIGLIAVALGVSIGATMGLISGYFGGVTESLVMRLVDTMLAFPGLLLALLIVAALGPSLRNVMIAVGIGGVPTYARLVRGSCLTVREMDYVAAVRVMGGGHLRIMLKHILPNLLGPVIVLSTLQIGTAILAGSGLSYLGMGAQPPAAEWGLMTAQGRTYMAEAWWLSTFPGLAIFTVVMAVNLMGDGMRGALDPRGRSV